MKTEKGKKPRLRKKDKKKKKKKNSQYKEWRKRRSGKDFLFLSSSFLSLENPIYMRATINTQGAGGWDCNSRNPKRI